MSRWEVRHRNSRDVGAGLGQPDGHLAVDVNRPVRVELLVRDGQGGPHRLQVEGRRAQGERVEHDDEDAQIFERVDEVGVVRRYLEARGRGVAAPRRKPLPTYGWLRHLAGPEVTVEDVKEFRRSLTKQIEARLRRYPKVKSTGKPR